MATLTLIPSKAGDNTEVPSQYPASGEHWDKVAVNDAGATYIYTAFVGPAYQLELYGYDPTVRGGKINSVTVYMIVYNTPDEPGFYKNAIKTHSTVYYGSENSMWGSITWDTYSTVWALNPYTSSLWTWSEIYELQFGLSIKSRAGRCTYVYAVVDYTVENVKPGLIDMGMM